MHHSPYSQSNRALLTDFFIIEQGSSQAWSISFVKLILFTILVLPANGLLPKQRGLIDAGWSPQPEGLRSHDLP